MLKKAAASLLLVALSACSGSNANDKVSLDQARTAHEGGKVLLIDIREKREHLTGVAQGAVLLPMSELEQKSSLIPKDPAQPVLLICNTQNRSKATVEMLKKQGYQNVRYVEGGMSQWTAKGWPMVTPRETTERSR
jgi:rhodanese-related sulfurtransferase